jgi:hypothetical protein
MECRFTRLLRSGNWQRKLDVEGVRVVESDWNVGNYSIRVRALRIPSQMNAVLRELPATCDSLPSPGGNPAANRS